MVQELPYRWCYLENNLYIWHGVFHACFTARFFKNVNAQGSNSLLLTTLQENVKETRRPVLNKNPTERTKYTKNLN